MGRVRPGWAIAAAALAVSLALPSAGGATSSVTFSDANGLGVAIFPDVIDSQFRAGHLILEPYSDAVRPNGFRVRPRDGTGNNIRTSDGDCFGNNLANDVICTGVEQRIAVTGSRLGDRITVRGRDERHVDTCLIPPPSPLRAFLDLGLGDDLLRVDQAVFTDPDDICASGTVPVNLNEGPVLVVASGGPGDDDLEGEDQNDTLSGQDDDDVLRGHEGNDILVGGPGNDTLLGAEGDDAAAGDAGDDTIDGSSGSDALSGQDGNDTFTAGSGTDGVDGGPGNDRIDGGSGDDILLGSDGDDIFDAAGTGADRMDGGAGFDTADYSAVAGRVNVFLDGQPNDGRPSPAAEGDDLLNIERVVGTGGPDILAGQGNLDGRGGQDFIFGGPANGDVLTGGTGPDQLTGGPNPGQPSGNDTIFSVDGETDIILCGDGNDVLIADLVDPTPAACENAVNVAVDDGMPSTVRRLRLAQGGVDATVRCPRDARVRCAGVLTLLEGRRQLGTAKYRIPIGRAQRIHVELPTATRRGLHPRDVLAARTKEKGISKKGPRRSRALLPLLRP